MIALIDSENIVVSMKKWNDEDNGIVQSRWRRCGISRLCGVGRPYHYIYREIIYDKYMRLECMEF
jgi:hypothetical protein